MTDVPRRAYPLVVPPPGGFEDAVRRGRRRRHKQSGGSSALALVLVGALAYSMVGHGGGANHLDPTNQPKAHQTQPAANGDAPESAAPTTTPRAGGSRATGAPPTTSAYGTPPPGVPTAAPTSVPGAVPGAHPPRTGGTRAYAPRNRIDRSAASTASEISCLPAQNEQWCTFARATVQAGGVSYLLELAVCSSVATGGGVLTYEYARETDFRLRDIAHNDVVWTHSLGQPVTAFHHVQTFGAGDCIVWSTLWDGYDDYGYTPPAGTYELTAISTAADNLPDARAQFDVS